MTVLLGPASTSGRPGEPAHEPPEPSPGSSSSWGLEAQIALSANRYTSHPTACAFPMNSIRQIHSTATQSNLICVPRSMSDDTALAAQNGGSSRACHRMGGVLAADRYAASSAGP